MNNSTAIGYMILAMKYLGYKDAKIKEMESEMKYQMDMRTEEQADQTYMQF